MSIKLPEKALEAAKSVIVNHYSERFALGFLVNSTAMSDLGVALSCAINKVVESKDIDISIFSVLNEPATIIPYASIFNIAEINVYFGKLVATDVFTWIYLSQMRANPIFYVFDPARLQFANKRLLDQMKQNTLFIARSEEHKQYLNNTYGIKVAPILIPDFEIPLFERLLK